MKHTFMAIVVIIFLLFFTLSFSECDREPLWFDIEFVNNTDYTLACESVLREVSDTIFPDKTLFPDGIEEITRVIKPHSTHVSRYNRYGFKHLAEKGLYESFYFFDVDTIKNVSWERIKKEKIFVKVIDIYSWDDLENKYGFLMYVP